ncbi:patatin-like phospholipase family protein [Orenia marismortui]|uniref:NTE family protein n=1 Tax=Orenia marismortui TaxID=46469 RepID=A0A4R8GZ98_9FIRM|nr:patatin-like phospholipase family protein [Orenia marismortui]TDX51836.1 NTE family protein [Orenia marismortui]
MVEINKLKINLSLSGGGVKGVAHVGGIKALEDKQIQISGIAGTSAGAIIATLYGAGYNCSELKEILFEEKFARFKDSFSLSRLVKKFGLYKGDNFFRWIKEKLKAKGIRAFKDFNKEVIVVASNVSNKRSEVFSRKNTPYVSVAEAVRMSMSIPVFYMPYKYLSNLYVDGGVMNNLPLKVFNKSKLPNLGFILYQDEKKTDSINGFIDYLSALVEMIMTLNERHQIELSRSHLISIPTGDIKATDFSLSRKEKEWLYQSGYINVEKSLLTFKDRRLRKSIFKFQDLNNIKSTPTELREFASEMVDYIIEKVDVDSFDTIVTSSNDEHYLFSYFVASEMNKKFTTINPYRNNLDYNYSYINKEERVIILNFKHKNKELLEIIKKVEEEGIEIIDSFSFINDKKNKCELCNCLNAHYSYYII